MSKRPIKPITPLVDESRKAEQAFTGSDIDEEDCLQLNDEKYRMVATRLRELKPSRVLDIGVWTGVFYEKHVPELIGNVYGIEIQEKFLDRAIKRGIQATRVNIESEPLPYTDNHFDVVVCDSLLEHTLNPKHLMTEIQRVLCPGGTLILAVPNANSARRQWGMLRGRNPFHPLVVNLYNFEYMVKCAVFYAPEELHMIMDNAFKIETMTYLDETHHDVPSHANTFCRLWSRFVPRTRDQILLTASKL